MSEIHCQFCEKICLNGFLDCSHTAHQKCLEENGGCLYCQFNLIDNTQQTQIQTDVPKIQLDVPNSDIPIIDEPLVKKKVKRTKRTVHECTICLCEITKKHKVHVSHKFLNKNYFKVYECCHVYHDKCAKKWNKSNNDKNTCPMRCLEDV